MDLLEIIFLAFIVSALVLAGFYFLNRWAMKKLDAQQTLIKKTRTLTTIYVIDKKRDKITNVKLPKAAVDSVPRAAKLLNMYFVQAKIGPVITTLVCEKNVFNAVPVKKQIKVGLSGIYITDIPGMKTEKELKKEKKEKQAAKEQTSEKIGLLGKFFGKS